MEDRRRAATVSDKSLAVPVSESKLMGVKRSNYCDSELGEEDEVARKRIKAKMGDLEASFPDYGIDSHNEKSFKGKEATDQFQCSEEEVSHVTEELVAMNSDGSQADRIEKDMLPLLDKSIHKPLDLNTVINSVNNSACNDGSKCSENADQLFFPRKHGTDNDNHLETCRGIGLDLNAEDVSSSLNEDTHYPCKIVNHLKSRDVSDCGSTTGPLEERDPLRVWKEMKQNGFMSSSHGSIPRGIPMQKQHRGRKSKPEVLRKKVELAKREQVDRFTRMAAPSGLLNALNPGIINHVRNKKQVHSIIEALVRSEKLENRHVESKLSCHLKSTEKEAGHIYSSMAEMDGAVDALTLKLSSSSTNTSENASSLSNEESGNLTSVCTLSVKAATVASQWLELLHLDIKGRLAALRRSKKRVRAVINTELPFPISKEFSSDQGNATADIHRTRWTVLFDQMDKALSEEETQLENWLNQVKEMQLHCDQGLQNVNWNAAHSLQPLKTLEHGSGSRTMDSVERELAVRATAASIYSTSNFLLSK